MGKKNKKLSNKLPRMIGVSFNGGPIEMVPLERHEDGSVSWAVPLPDHIDRLFEQAGLLDPFDESREALKPKTPRSVH